MGEQTPQSAETDVPEPPRLIPIDAPCVGCGAPLAWRMGVGRYVISHATGDDRCSRETARLADEYREAARAAYVAADAEWQRRLNTPPGQRTPAQPEADPDSHEWLGMDR